MHAIIVREAGPPRRAAVVPIVLLAACVLPPLAVILAVGLIVPAVFAASAFRQTATEER